MWNILRAFRHAPFSWLWCGQTVSRLGDSIFRIALAWWVLQETGSAEVMGATLIFSTTPMLVFSLLGGAVVDRLPRIQIMLASDVLRCAIVTCMALLAASDSLQVWQVYVFSAVFGVVDAFFQPAYRAAFPELLPPDLLNSANSLSTLSWEFAGLLGPALGAALVAAGGTTLGFALNASSFLLSGVCLLPLLPLSPTPRRAGKSAGILHDIGSGLAAVFATPWIWITIAVAGISNLTYAGPMGVALPFLIKEQFHADVHLFGYFYTFMSAGAVLGALWLGRKPQVHHRGWKMYAVWLLIGLTVAAMGLGIPVPLLLLAGLLIGGSNSLLGLLWLSALQELVPRDLQGRVSSIDFLGSSLLEPVGYALGGWATALLGPAALFVVGGLLQTALISLGLLHPQIRDLD